MTPLVDATARRDITSRLDVNVIVEAAAGTGKTTALVGRIVAVLARGLARVDRIVAVTFTEKAAGELKLRLRAGLEEARRDTADDTVRENLEHALAHLEDARVSTIHGFCADILRERPVEARTDPQFEVLTDGDARALYHEAFDLWLQRCLDDPPEGVRRSLRRQAGWRDDDAPAERLRHAGVALVDWRDLRAPWRREAFDRERIIDTLVETVLELADFTDGCSNPRDAFHQDTAAARRLRDDVRTSERVRERDYDGLESALINLVEGRDGRNFAGARRGYDSNWRHGPGRAALHELHARLVTTLSEFKRVADADLAALLQGELAETIERYEALKAAAGRLDFLDLLLRARDLLRDCAGVREDFQRRFSHVFVDEFQDTDPVQAEILLLLSARDATVATWRDVTPVPGKLFIVGDPKQSIYRFRRADVGVYQDVRRLLVSSGALPLTLTTSFRSVPGIQRAVNAAFGPRMDGDTTALQADYVDLSPSRPEHPDQPSVVALPVPRPYGARGVTMTAIEASLPDAVGAFVAWLVRDSGWTVTERDAPDVRVPVAARHICILFRRFSTLFKGDMTRPYVAALEARDISHLLVGGRSFHAREEVSTLRAALSAVEWPDSELSVFATLRGSLFGIGDEELLAYRAAFGRLHPFRASHEAIPEDLAPIVDALALLRSLHVNRNRRPVADTIHALLQFTRAHAGFALRPSGEQALANVLHIAELARAYELSGGISFRGFVAQLESDALAGQTSDAPILEEGSDGVRIMTVHKAKGLEFPVVILADPTCALRPNEASRHLDPGRGLCAVKIAGWTPADLLDHGRLELSREEAEAVRITYVAATRARDLLVVPAVGDEPYAKGWLGPLNAAIYPPPGRRRNAEEAPNCPAFGVDSVTSRPFEGVPEESVQPGRHAFDAGGGYDVVWWDPSTLELGTRSAFGLRRHELLDKDVDDALVRRDVDAHARWAATRVDALAQGERPTVVVRSVREYAAEIVEGRFPGAGSALAGDVSHIDIVTESLVADPARPSGRRFGSLVHAVLALVPLDGSAEAIVRVARQRGRVLGATDDEVEAAAAAVGSALALPVMRRAQAAAVAGRCRREVPVSVADEFGTIVDGVADLAFLENDRWWVVDFKTDQDVETHVALYEHQVRLYAGAIHRATGVATSGILVRV